MTLLLSRLSSRWRHASLASFLLLLLPLACSSPGKSSSPAPEAVQVAPPKIPAFLTGPAAILLTNSTDYAARIVSKSDDGTTTGKLFQQEGWLLFVPMSSGSSASKTPTFRFLWQVAPNTGYVISEALHGYVVVSPPERYRLAADRIRIPADVFGDTGGSSENVTVLGGPTGSVPFQITLGDGGMPVRIQSVNGNTSVELSDMEPDRLAPDLFLPPARFTRFNNVDEMVRELTKKPRVMPYTHTR